MTRRPIQIWQPDGEGWTRSQPTSLGDHHSPTLRLVPKSEVDAPRVVLTGESVAAGYLYAPRHRPATMLAELLPHHDVVDLARVNEGLGSLVETVEAAAQLEPDIVVAWAGNNWMVHDLAALSPYHPEATHRRELGEALVSDGLAGAAAVARNALDGLAPPLLDRLFDAVRSIGARLIWVIPEVGLVDWDSCQPVTWLPPGRAAPDPVAAWYRAWRAGDPTTMFELDGRSSPNAHRLAASQHADDDEALVHLRAEIEAASGPMRACRTSPMATPSVQRLLRSWCARSDVATVDVPDLIAAGGGRPDRRWFLDYCHHTSEGLDVVVEGVARAIDPTVRRRRATRPDAEDEAVALLGAMVHTAHTWVSAIDRRPTLRYWRDHALGAWGGAADLLDDLVESRLGRAPMPLRSAVGRLAAAGFGLAHGLRPVGVEADLLQVAGIGDRWSRIALGTDAAWLDRVCEPAALLWTDGPGAPRETPLMYRSVWPVSRLAVDAAGRRGLIATLRAPEPGTATVRVGGSNPNVTVPVTSRWQSVEIPLPETAAPGPTIVEIEWSMPGGRGRWSAMLDGLVRDEPVALHPVFGEVAELRSA